MGLIAFIKSIFSKWECAFCQHDNYEVLDMRVEGATMSWSGLPVRQVGWSYRCKRCGFEWYKGGCYVAGDRKLHPECYDYDGWPMDPATNERLTIAD